MTGEHLSVADIAALVAPEPEVEELEQAMTLVREQCGSVAALLRSSLAPGALGEATARSYWHPNGFAKIVLLDAGVDGTSVRLHVWPAAATDATPEELQVRRDSAPHGHRWNFASTVIAGSGLFVEEFVVTPVDGESDGTLPGDPSVYEMLVFEPAVSPVPRHEDWARLRCREYWVRDPIKDVYWCHVDDVHTVGPIDGGMTATLVLQGSEVRDTAPVFRRPDGPADPGRRPIDEDEVATLIRDVLTEMGAPVLADH